MNRMPPANITAYTKKVAAAPIRLSSTGKKKVITEFQKKFVTTAIDTALPRTLYGKISAMSNHAMGPNPTW